MIFILMLKVGRVNLNDDNTYLMVPKFQYAQPLATILILSYLRNSYLYFFPVSIHIIL